MNLRFSWEYLWIALFPCSEIEEDHSLTLRVPKKMKIEKKLQINTKNSSFRHLSVFLGCSLRPLPFTFSLL